MRVPAPQSFRALSILSVVFLLAVSAQAVVYTNAYVKGSYSFLMNKWTADTTSNQDGLLGVMHFDGAGNVTVSFNDMAGGTLTTGTGSGTYVVNSNGTGSISLTGAAQIAIVLNSTVAKVATSLQMLTINYPHNEVQSGTAVLQTTAAATYTAASLKGIMAFQIDSWTDDLTQARTCVVGLLNFNGAGKVTGSFTEVKTGVPSTGTVTGTYIVNTDGSGTLSLVSGTDSFQIAMVLNTVAVNTTTKLGVAKAFQMLQTTETTNRVDSGIAMKQ